MKFKANENLFRIGDNWVCVSDDEIREGDWVYNEGSVMKFTAFPKMHYKKIIFSYPNHIDDSIPVLDGGHMFTEDDIRKAIDFSLQYSFDQHDIRSFQKDRESFIKSLAQPKEIEMIQVASRMVVEETEAGNCHPYREPITLPNGKVKCKVK